MEVQSGPRGVAVEFQLRAIYTGTELTLIHAALRDELSVRNHERGWAGALGKLVRIFSANSKENDDV